MQAAAIAGYLKPFLPQELAVPALSELDRFFFVDKEVRARKGRWEQTIVESLNKQSRYTFKKRRFEVGKESFEIDAAAPGTGKIEVAIDVKRIEARRDIHKRADEIINKAPSERRKPALDSNASRPRSDPQTIGRVRTVISPSHREAREIIQQAVQALGFRSVVHATLVCPPGRGEHGACTQG